MAYLKLIAPTVDALVIELQAQLPAVIAEINADHSDGYQLTTPTVLDYIPARAELVAFPTIGIQDLPTRFQDDIGSVATGVIELGLIAFVTHPERKGLARLCRRWQQALATVALSGRTIGTAAYGVTLRQVTPGPTLARDEDPRGWETISGVIVRAFTDE